MCGCATAMAGITFLASPSLASRDGKARDNSSGEVIMWSNKRGVASVLAFGALLVGVIALEARRVGLAAGGGRPEPEPPPTVQVLAHTEAIPFPSPGPNAIENEIKCSPGGDIYTVFTSQSGPLPSDFNRPGGLFKAPVTRVSVFSRKLTAYPIPAIPGYHMPSRESFDVRPDGTLYALLETARQSMSQPQRKPEPANFIVEYNEDGTVASRIRIRGEPGKRIQPLRLAAFADGSFLLSGTTTGGNQLGTFAGIFSRQGTFVAPLQLGNALIRSEDGSPGISGTSGEPPESGQISLNRHNSGPNPVSLASSTLSASLQDGNVYVLQGSREATLYAVSAAGYILRSFTVKLPAPGLRPVQMAAAGAGYLFVDYRYVPSGAPGEVPEHPEMIVVLDTQTGEEVRIYQMPNRNSDFAVPACADSPDDFLFIGSTKDNRLEVIRYSAR
jgi:hypothetical protein